MTLLLTGRSRMGIVDVSGLMMAKELSLVSLSFDEQA